jgi:hypothetical protein
MESLTTPPVVFPSSNTDTIPSSNSAIVKYKTSRDYMLDTLSLPSKEQREKALKRSIERGNPLPIKGNDSQLGNFPSRYETKPRPSNPLAKIAIATDRGTAVSSSSSPSPSSSSGPSSALVYQKHQIRKVRNLRDRMLSSTGSAGLFSTDGHSLRADQFDPVRTHHSTLLSSKLTKEQNEEDHTAELLKLPGFLENIGPNNFYMTSNNATFNYPNNGFTEAVGSPLSVSLSVYLSVYLSVSLCLCLSLPLSLSVCLSPFLLSPFLLSRLIFLTDPKS